MRLVLAALAFSSVGASYTAYRKALLRELGVPGVNLTHGDDGLLRATTRFEPGALAFVVPPKYVLTVQEALGSGAGSMINKHARSLRKTLPRHFVLAMWVLYTKHVQKRRNDLWGLWLASLPSFDTTPLFWDEAELPMLEEERVLKRSRSRREMLEDEYEGMVRVLLEEAGLEDDAGEGVISLREYMWAVTAVTACSLHFAEDFPVLVPMRVRFHPYGAAEVYEWGDEQDPGAALYVGEDGLAEGRELTVYTDQFNDELMLHGGHAWDEPRATSPLLRLSAGELGRRAAGSYDEAVEARRTELMAMQNWSSVMDFALAVDELPPELLSWMRLALATPEQVEAAESPQHFDAPLSAPSERQAIDTLLLTVERSLGAYEFSIEEDEQLLQAARRGAVDKSARELAAVGYRLGCKRVLHATRRLAAAHLAGVAQAARRKPPRQQQKGEGKTEERPSPSTMTVGVSPTGSQEEAAGVVGAAGAAGAAGGAKKKRRRKKKKSA